MRHSGPLAATERPMTDKLQIYFVTWPDGKLFEGTQTSVSERHATAAAMHTWLHRDWFPGLNLLQSYSAHNELWQAMQRAGFKVHSMAVPDDMAKGISR